jgi:integrase/recombinase XerD
LNKTDLIDDKSAQNLTDFLDFVVSEKGLSKNTYLAYQKDLQEFIDFCRVKRTRLETVEVSDLRYYIAHLKRRSLNVRSIARKVTAIRQFYRFMMREGRVQSDPSELVNVLVRSKKLPKHFTQKEVLKLLNSVRGDSEGDIRDRALLEFWYATGARVSEVTGVGSSDVDFDQKVVRLLGKGGRPRIVPLSDDSLTWCKKFQVVRHEWMRRVGIKQTKAFFITPQGGQLTRQAVWKLFKRHAKRAGIERNVWPHMIRHSFATHVLNGGADLRAVQELLGHRSIATTEIYTHLDLENLKLMQQKYHPRS